MSTDGSYSSSSQGSSSDDEDIIIKNLTGQLLDNRYFLIKNIGAGAFATVWLSYHIPDRKFFAIKVQNSEDYDAAMEEISLMKRFKESGTDLLNKIQDRFIHEEIKSNNGNKISKDPKIVKKNVCMVFELMAGSVYDVMKDYRIKDGFDLSITKRIVYQLL